MRYCLFIVLIFQVLSCKTKSEGTIKFECNIDKIRIIDKTGNTYIRDTIIISDRDVIDEFCSYMRKLSPTSGYNIRANKGYVQFEIKKPDSEYFDQSFDMVYTVFDGVIFMYKGSGCKNKLTAYYLISLIERENKKANK